MHVPAPILFLPFPLLGRAVVVGVRGEGRKMQRQKIVAQSEVHQSSHRSDLKSLILFLLPLSTAAAAGSPTQ